MKGNRKKSVIVISGIAILAVIVMVIAVVAINLSCEGADKAFIELHSSGPGDYVVPNETYCSHIINITDNSTVVGAAKWYTNVTNFTVNITNGTIANDDITNISIFNLSGGSLFGYNNTVAGNDSVLIELVSGQHWVNDTTVNFSINITVNTTGLIDGKWLAPNVSVFTEAFNDSSGTVNGTNITWANDTLKETINVLDATAGTSNETALKGDKNVLCANVTINPGNNTVVNYLKAITFNATQTTMSLSDIETFGLWNDTNQDMTFNSASDTLINSTTATSVNVTFNLSSLAISNRIIPAGQNGTFFLTMNITADAATDKTYKAMIFAQNITINQTAGEGNTGNSSDTTGFNTLTIEAPTPAPAPARRIVGGGGPAPAAAPGETTVSTEPTGEVTSTVTAPSADGKAVVTISAETIAKDAAGSPLTSVTVTQPSALPAGAPSGANYVGYAYTFGPAGATFSKPVTISITFDTAKYEGKTPVIHVYEAGAWKALATTVVGNRATATVTHFSTFVLFAAEEVITPTPTATPTPKPTPTATPSLTPTPTPEGPGFEAVFAIAGLLAVAYLVLRRKRK
ncbi:MAG: PGF-CTERM sorting domain-containing protein [Halobacteriota archaeon]